MKKSTVFLFVFLVNISTMLAQIYGCTDPQANNYNPLAEINDGSCTFGTSILSPNVSVALPNGVSETSGLFYYNGKYWTHNDDTDAMLFAIDSLTAEVLDTVLWDCLSNIDWEEAHVNGTHLIVGDIGNNLGNRTDLKFFIIPLVAFYSNDINTVDTLQFAYEDQVTFAPSLNNHDFDAEAFVATTDSVFIFSKCWMSLETKRYALSLVPGVQVARLRETYALGGLITGASFINQNQSVALCGYSAFLQPFVLLLYDYDNGLYFNGNKRRVELGLPFHQVEGIVHSHDFEFFLSNERYTGALNVDQKWHHWNASSLFSNPAGISEEELFTIDDPFPNPTRGYFELDVPVANCYWRYEIFNVQGELIKRGFQLSRKLHFDISDQPDGMYYVHIYRRETRFVKSILKQTGN